MVTITAERSRRRCKKRENYLKIILLNRIPSGRGRNRVLWWPGVCGLLSIFAPFRLHSRKRSFRKTSLLIDFKWWSNGRSLLLCAGERASNGHFPGVKSVGNSRKFLINFNFGEILKESLEFLKQLLRFRHRMARESFFFVASVVLKLSLRELLCLRQVEQ